jgi:hypothetical protein
MLSIVLYIVSHSLAGKVFWGWKKIDRQPVRLKIIYVYIRNIQDNKAYLHIPTYIYNSEDLVYPGIHGVDLG